MITVIIYVLAQLAYIRRATAALLMNSVEAGNHQIEDG